MGLFDKLANVLGLKKKECNVLIVGLDNSGKSTLLNHFKPEEQRQGEIVPTVGFNVEKFKSKSKRFWLGNEREFLASCSFPRVKSIFCLNFHLQHCCSESTLHSFFVHRSPRCFFVFLFKHVLSFI